MYGKCPHCGQFVTHLAVASPEVHRGTRAMWQGVAFLCPRCTTILGAGLDPLVQKAELINEIVNALKAESTDGQAASPQEQAHAYGTGGR